MTDVSALLIHFSSRKHQTACARLTVRRFSYSFLSCEDCPAGQTTPPITSKLTYGFNSCKCPDGSYLPDYAGQVCVACPTGSTAPYAGASYCMCGPLRAWISATGKCLDCPPRSTGDGYSCRFDNAQEGFDEDLGTCFTCPSDSTGAFGRFCRCNDPSKQVLTSPMGVRTCGCSDGTTSCICSASQYRNTVSNACKTCPAGSTKSADGLSCTCLGSAIFDPTNSVCVTCPSDYDAFIQWANFR